jgi:hypothetical protein
VDALTITVHKDPEIGCHDRDPLSFTPDFSTSTKGEHSSVCLSMEDLFAH